jgi:hypothetical protein
MFTLLRMRNSWNFLLSQYQPKKSINYYLLIIKKKGCKMFRARAVTSALDALLWGYSASFIDINVYTSRTAAWNQETSVFFFIGIVGGGGVQLGPLGTVAATNGLLCQSRGIMMMEKLVEWFAGETEVLWENLPQCHFVHHKPHMLPGREPGPPRWEASD